MSKRKAVVVGINEYGGPPNDLPSCVNDANAFAQLLQSSYGYTDIHMLLDSQATQGNVEKELDWLVKDVGADDRVVFYFSGHGYTKPVNDVMQEFLVLLDESKQPLLWQDDNLVAKTQSLPEGTLMTVLDACQSGGLFKLILDPSQGAEVAQVKMFQPPPTEQAKAFAPILPDGKRRAARITKYRRFGGGTAMMADSAASPGGTGRKGKATQKGSEKALSDETETGDQEMNGLLLSACLETETAAASTSQTEGLSAFTYALLRAVEELGSGRSTVDVFNRTAAILKEKSFRQTPLLLQRAQPGTLHELAFLSLDAMGTTGKIAPTGEGGSTAPQENEDSEKALAALLRSLARATPGLIDAVTGGHKAVDLGDDGQGQPSEEEVQKFLPLLLSAAASLAPVFIKAANGRRKAVDLGADEQEQASAEEAQKFLQFLPALLQIAGPIIRNVANGPRKAVDLGGDEQEQASAEEAQKFLQFLPALLQIAGPIIRNVANGPRKAVDLGGDEQEQASAEEAQKFLQYLPGLIRIADPFIRNVVNGRRKAVDLGGDEQEEASAEETQKFLQYLPALLQIAGPIIRNVGNGRRKAVDLGGNEQEQAPGVEAQKFISLLLAAGSVLVPVLARAASGHRKALDLGGNGNGQGQPSQDEAQKAFSALLRSLLKAAPGIIGAMNGPRKAAREEVDHKSLLPYLQALATHSPTVPPLLTTLMNALQRNRGAVQSTARAATAAFNTHGAR